MTDPFFWLSFSWIPKPSSFLLFLCSFFFSLGVLPLVSYWWKFPKKRLWLFFLSQLTPDLSSHQLLSILPSVSSSLWHILPLDYTTEVASLLVYFLQSHIPQLFSLHTYTRLSFLFKKF